jgi:large subunit ribosomal protein L13
MSSPVHRIAARGVRLWHHVDARNQVLGRLTTQIAHLLMGKHKPTYTPSVDCGDYVVVTNAAEVALTGNKRTAKLYRWHTGWMGGLKTLTARQMFERDPRRVVSLAVKGMLPRNPIRDLRLTRLRVFPGEAHEHAAQLAQSQAYAAPHLAAVAPRSVHPRQKVEGGALVKDAASELSPEALEEVKRGMVLLQHDAAFAAQYDAFRAERVERAQAAQDAADLEVLAAVREMEAQEAAAAAAAATAAPASAPRGRQLK